jgi:hypothetical protein
MKVPLARLPRMIYLEDFGGNYTSYIDAVYEVFKRDFIDHQTSFGSNCLRLKHHPEYQDRAYTFYHMTHEGKDEQNRTPDLRRCERMPWARPTIETFPPHEVRFWEQIRSGHHRICIWLEIDERENYYVVLDVRKTFVLLWTAFCAMHPHQARKKAKEHAEWYKNNPNITTPDELVADIQSRI